MKSKTMKKKIRDLECWFGAESSTVIYRKGIKRGKNYEMYDDVNKIPSNVLKSAYEILIMMGSKDTDKTKLSNKIESHINKIDCCFEKNVDITWIWNFDKKDKHLKTKILVFWS